VSVEADAAWSSIMAPSFDPYDWPWDASDRWVRFYTHPDGRQGPTSSDEWDEVVRRVTTIIDAASADDVAQIMLLTGNSQSQGAPPVQSESQLAVQPHATFWREVLDSNGLAGNDEEVWAWQLWVSWHTRAELPGAELIRRVEDKALEWVSLVMPNARLAVHPYDGGIDVLLTTTEERDRWRARHMTWASPRPDGR
jgi:hypothetical protein